uniref:G-protein coupled receptors family 1 profile domain-containing protein n=1 Tax=Strongyloides stercoralis TaxID=6248 RepID=A0A0K0EHJ0_STRER
MNNTESFNTTNLVNDASETITILTNVQIGLIYLFTSLSLFFLQIFTTLNLYKINNLKKNVTFKIMLNHSVIASISLTCHITTSIITIIKVEDKIYFDSIIGSILESSYFCCVEIMFLLTVNRFDIMYNNIILPKVERKKLYLYTMIFCYSMALPFLIGYIIPENRLEFNFGTYEWFCYSHKPVTSILCFIENKLILSLLTICCILQILIFTKVIYLRCITSKKNILSFHDIKFVIHAVMCFFTVLILELIWNNVLHFVYQTELTSLIPSLLSIFVAGSNSVFTFCFVREIRKNIFCCQPKKKFVSTTILLEKKRVTRF